MEHQAVYSLSMERCSGQVLEAVLPWSEMAILRQPIAFDMVFKVLDIPSTYEVFIALVDPLPSLMHHS
jgi:hypothetical protein